MTGPTGRERFFPLFLRHGLIPEPEAVSQLRKEGARELAAMEAQSSRRVGVHNARAWDATKRDRQESLISAIEAARSDIRNYPHWSPTADDWTRLAIGLAIKHAEPGFAFQPPRPDPTAEQNWHRHRLMESVMAADRVPAEGAAIKAERYIAKLHESGQGAEYGSHNSAGYLKGGYSARNKADQDGREVDKKYRSKLPHYIDAAFLLQAHFREILEEAVASNQPQVD